MHSLNIDPDALKNSKCFHRWLDFYFTRNTRITSNGIHCKYTSRFLVILYLLARRQPVCARTAACAPSTGRDILFSHQPPMTPTEPQRHCCGYGCRPVLHAPTAPSSHRHRTHRTVTARPLPSACRAAPAAIALTRRTN